MYRFVLRNTAILQYYNFFFKLSNSWSCFLLLLSSCHSHEHISCSFESYRHRFSSSGLYKLLTMLILLLSIMIALLSFFQRISPWLDHNVFVLLSTTLDNFGIHLVKNYFQHIITNRLVKSPGRQTVSFCSLLKAISLIWSRQWSLLILIQRGILSRKVNSPTPDSKWSKNLNSIRKVICLLTASWKTRLRVPYWHDSCLTGFNSAISVLLLCGVPNSLLCYAAVVSSIIHQMPRLFKRR